VAAVLSWANSSASVIAMGGVMDDATMMIRLMPEALSQLLDSEPWLQIAGKVSETHARVLQPLYRSVDSTERACSL